MGLPEVASDYKNMRFLRVMGSIPRSHFEYQKTAPMDRSTSS